MSILMVIQIPAIEILFFAVFSQMLFIFATSYFNLPEHTSFCLIWSPAAIFTRVLLSSVFIWFRARFTLSFQHRQQNLYCISTGDLCWNEFLLV